MASTTVRVSEHTHDLLRKLAEATGEPLQKALERAVENYRRERFFAELNEAYARLQADPVAWEEELAERALWETTLAGGLYDWWGPFAAAKSGSLSWDRPEELSRRANGLFSSSPQTRSTRVDRAW